MAIAGILAAVLAEAPLGVELDHPRPASALLWPAPGVAVSALLVAPARRRLVTALLIAGVATAAYWALTGSWMASLPFGATTVLAAALVASISRGAAWQQPELAAGPDLLRLILVVAAASLTAALAEAAALALLGLPTLAKGWGVAAVSTTISILVVVAGQFALASLLRGPPGPRAGEGVMALVVLAVLAATLVLGPTNAAGWGAGPALAALAVPILWVGSRAPASLAVLTPAVVAPFVLWSASTGRGPVPDMLAAASWLMIAALLAFIPARLAARSRLAEARLQAALSGAGSGSDATTLPLAQSLAHELMQPLTAVANYASAARDLVGADAAPDRGALGEILDDIITQAHRAGRIVQGLRDLAARADCARRPEPVESLIEEARALALDAPGDRGMVVRTTSDGAALVLVDKIQIQQVVVNLLRNAADAMAGQPHREVRIDLRHRSEQWIEISVSDDGPGLAPAVAASLFDPFVTTKGGHGRGLGLLICRTIVEAHGGTLRLERSGPGATFVLTLPRPPDAGGGHD